MYQETICFDEAARQKVRHRIWKDEKIRGIKLVGYDEQLEAPLIEFDFENSQEPKAQEIGRRHNNVLSEQAHQDRINEGWTVTYSVAVGGKHPHSIVVLERDEWPDAV